MYSVNQYLPWTEAYVPGDSLLNEWQATALVVVALTPLVVLGIYTAHKVYAILRFLWVYYGPLDYSPKPGIIYPGEEPVVSVLISCYNEAQVIRRTIDCACAIDWPADKLEICVLDDSTDVTKEIIDEAASEYQDRGINCRVIRRVNREGYKAGNLHYAQDMISGRYHALFDSDHMPTVDFLRKTMGHFYNQEGQPKPEIGLVQAPWGYYNIDTNMLTECDALMLDVHHIIEQRGRSRALGMFSFNGTGGVWRKEAIDSGGGWTWDTVTEDLDLSYRACLNGFRFVYVEDGPCGLEIPANISAFKSQKYRWDQGYAQVTKKSLIDLLTYPGATLSQKTEVFFHLTGGFQYPMTIWVLFWVPFLSYFCILPLFALLLMAGIVFIIFVQIIIAVALKPSYKGDYDGAERVFRLFYVIPAMMLNIGMSVNATLAVLAGLFKEGAVFVRTPKDGGPDVGSSVASHSVRDDDSSTGGTNYSDADSLVSSSNAPPRNAVNGSRIDYRINNNENAPGPSPSGSSVAPMSSPPTHDGSGDPDDRGFDDVDASAFKSVVIVGAASAAATVGLTSTQRQEEAKASKSTSSSNPVKSAKKKFVEKRRRRKDLPKYETTMDLKLSTILEVTAAIYFIVWVCYLFPSADQQVDIAQLVLLFVPSIAFTAFAFTAVLDYTKHLWRGYYDAFVRQVNYFSYYLFCCCLCGDAGVDKRVDVTVEEAAETIRRNRMERSSFDAEQLVV